MTLDPQSFVDIPDPIFFKMRDDFESHALLLGDIFSDLPELECPVCFTYAVHVPILLCQHGHYVCGMCLTKSTRDNKCPVCRQKSGLFRSHIAETEVKLRLQAFYVNCREMGCDVTGIPEFIRQHELYCEYKHVICPDGDSCTDFEGIENGQIWSGPKELLIDHFPKSALLKVKDHSTGFSGTLRDYDDPSKTHLLRNLPFKRFQRVLLITKTYCRLDPIFCVDRAENGDWLFSVRTYSDREIATPMVANISIRNSWDQNQSCCDSSFIGPFPELIHAALEFQRSEFSRRRAVVTHEKVCKIRTMDAPSLNFLTEPEDYQLRLTGIQMAVLKTGFNI